MPTFRRASLLLAALLPLATAAMAQERPAGRAPLATRAAEFDRLFEQIDTSRLKPATPEEAKANLARLRALVPPGDARRRLLYQSLMCLEPPEDAQASLEYARRGLAEARARNDLDAEVRFLYCEAGYLEMAGDVHAALERYDRGIELSRRLEDAQLLGDGLMLRGNIRSYLGDYALALTDFVAAQRIYESAGLRDSAESNLQNIAVTYRRMGEYDKARQYLEQSREIALRQQDWYGVLVQWLQLGYLHEELQQPDEALAAYDQALQVTRERLAPGDSGAIYLGIASARVAKGEYAKALEALEHARRDFDSIKDRSSSGMLALVEAQARAGLGQHDRALALFDESERILREERNDRYLAMLYPARARAHERLGNTSEALEDYKRYLVLHEKLLDARNDQRTLVMRQQFDATRRDLENQRLRTEKALRDQEVQALLKARRWQWSALGLGIVLLAVLVGLVVRQVARTRRLRVLALTDELTGVANRRRIELISEEAIARAHAEGQPLSLVTLDIDYFKRINDTYGHLAGDEVINRVAAACQQSLRQSDELGRTGGEEFLVVLPETTLDAAAHIGERLRASVEALQWDDIAPDLTVTVSLGIAELGPDDEGLKDLLRRADAALYKAKAAGRNTYEVG